MHNLGQYTSEAFAALQLRVAELEQQLAQVTAAQAAAEQQSAHLQASLDAMASHCNCCEHQTDITQHKQREEELLRNEARYRALLDALPDMLFILSSDNTYLDYMGEPTSSLIPPEEFLGKRSEDILPPDLAQMFLYTITQVLQSKETQSLEYVVPLNNALNYYEARVSAIDDDTVLGLVRNITERKQQEAALYQSEERLRLVLEATNDGIWDWNVVTGEVYYSPRWKTMLGYEPDELSNDVSAWESLLHPDDAAQAHDIVNAHLQGQSPAFVVEFRLRMKSGEWLWTQGRGKIVARDEQGHPIRMVGTHTDITERKQQEEALRQQEASLRETQQFLQLVIDNIPQAIFWKDRDLFFLGCNRYFAAAAGLASPEAVIGKDDFMMPWVEHAEQHRVDDRQVMISGIPVQNIEEPFTDYAGNQRWRRTSKIPLRDADGAVFAFLGLFEDITERRRIEQALRLSEARYRAIVTHIPDTAFGMFDQQRRIILADGLSLATFGYTKTELEGRLLSEVLPPEIFERFAPLIQMAFAGETVIREYPLAERDLFNRQFYVPIHDEHGQVEHVLSITQDITEYKRAEQLLRESEERYRFISEMISDYAAVSSIAPDGTITLDWITTSLQRVIGRPFEEFRMGWPEFIYPDDYTLVADAVRKVTDGEESALEFRIVTDSGELRWLRNYIRPIWDQEQGRVVRLISAAQDITERRASEAERAVLIRDLEARNSELEQFTYTVSHDLKSPLITIKGYLGYIEQDALGGNIERLRSDLARIEQATEHMQRLLDELLELSRIGRLMNPSEWVHVGELVHDALLINAGYLQDKQIEISVAVDLPTVYGDRTRLREVVQNLLDNAVKFMGDQPTPRIEISVRPNTEPPVIYVGDNGIGIEPQYCDQIFGLFEKLSPQSSGTGIGLTLVKRIIEAHGGQIWAESAGRGTGTTFCFTVPKQIDPLQEECNER